MVKPSMSCILQLRYKIENIFGRPTGKVAWTGALEECGNGHNTCDQPILPNIEANLTKNNIIHSANSRPTLSSKECP